MSTFNVRTDDFTKPEMGKALSILFSMVEDVHVKDLTSIPKRTQERLYYSYMELARNHAAVQDRVRDLEHLDTSYLKQAEFIQRQKQQIAKLKCQLRQAKKNN